MAIQRWVSPQCETATWTDLCRAECLYQWDGKELWVWQPRSYKIRLTIPCYFSFWGEEVSNRPLIQSETCHPSTQQCHYQRALVTLGGVPEIRNSTLPKASIPWCARNAIGAIWEASALLLELLAIDLASGTSGRLPVRAAKAAGGSEREKAMKAISIRTTVAIMMAEGVHTVDHLLSLQIEWDNGLQPQGWGNTRPVNFKFWKDHFLRV